MFNTSRSDFAGALSTVDGVTGHEFRPSVMVPGDAWALIAQADRADGMDYVTTWQVLVVLAKDERTATAQFETLTPLLVDALRPVACVDSVTPVSIQTGAGEIPALQLTARSD